MNKRITVERIRKKYPNPSSCPADMALAPPSPNDYCVGGAFCLYVGYPAKAEFTGKRYDFPGPVSLAGVIQEYTGLKWSDAYHAGEEIISLNDRAKFDEAWESLKKVLRRGYKR